MNKRIHKACEPRCTIESVVEKKQARLLLKLRNAKSDDEYGGRGVGQLDPCKIPEEARDCMWYFKAPSDSYCMDRRTIKLCCVRFNKVYEE